MAIFNSDKNSGFNPQEINILNASTTINGDLNSEGDIRIDGQVKGNIQVKAKLVLGSSAKIDGNVSAYNCEVSGQVNGNIKATEVLTIKQTASIFGDISCSKLIIESGASFNGKSEMKGPLSIGNDFNKNKASKPIETKSPVNAENSILQKAGA